MLLVLFIHCGNVNNADDDVITRADLVGTWSNTTIEMQIDTIIRSCSAYTYSRIIRQLELQPEQYIYTVETYEMVRTVYIDSISGECQNVYSGSPQVLYEDGEWELNSDTLCLDNRCYPISLVNSGSTLGMVDSDSMILLDRQ